MLRDRTSLLVAALVLVVFACASDTPTRPVDEKSLVLAYTSQKGSTCHLVLSSLEGQRRVIDNSCGYGPAWSPDGSRLALDKPGGEAAPPSLWIINTDGSGEIEVSGGRGFADPEWSPDGSRIAAINLGAGVLTVMDADGSHRSFIEAASGLGFDRPSWSPDGATIMYSRSDTIFTVDVASGVADVQCVPGLQRISGARWSPDGTRISINADAPNRSGFYVMSADCSDQRLLADGSHDAGWASWSPDGTQVTYALALGDGTTLDVYVSPSDGSSVPQNLTNNSTGNASLQPDWAHTR